VLVCSDKVLVGLLLVLGVLEVVVQPDDLEQAMVGVLPIQALLVVSAQSVSFGVLAAFVVPHRSHRQT
jgi:hypothetical protein